MNQKAKQQESWKGKKEDNSKRDRGEQNMIEKNETGLELKAMM